MDEVRQAEVRGSSQLVLVLKGQSHSQTCVC